MAEKLAPYTPLHTLKPVAEGIWTADGGVIGMSYGPVTLPFTTRMVVVRMEDGGLWLWSPVDPEPGLIEEVARLGEVRHIVSPNAIHYAHIPAWAERWPEARVWASPGVRKRAKSQGIAVQFTDDLEEVAPEAWAREIDQVIFRGSSLLEEVAFFHRPSRSLILADMIENFEPERVKSRLLRTLMWLGGVLAPTGATPRDIRLTFRKRDGARAAVRTIRDWAPERVIIAHGRCIEENAQAELERAFAWAGA